MPETYYRLTGNAILCGFKGLPFGLYDGLKQKTYFFSREEYAFILRLAGTELIDEETLTEREKDILKNMKEEKLVEAKDSPTPLKPYQEYTKYENIYKLTAHWSVTGKEKEYQRIKEVYVRCQDRRRVFTEGSRNIGPEQNGDPLLKYVDQ